MTWLLTGGAGYIGSHVALALLEADMPVVVVDDLSTGDRNRLPSDVPLVEANILDTESLVRTMREQRVTGVIHLAAKKAVGESVERPLYYYEQNVTGMQSLLTAMSASDVTSIVYSSSAGVYGEPESSPVLEDSPTRPISPYGESKLIGEWLAADLARAGELSWLSLRYFNVAGAGNPDLGDTSVGNLIPIVLRQVGRGEPAQVFGDDYPTPDGTCIRDYIHVTDLAQAHVQAAQATASAVMGDSVNIGTGAGSSVLEVLESLGAALEHPVDYRMAPRRAGDPATLVAAVDRARDVLGWTASLNLDDMTKSAVAAWKAAK